MTDPAVSVAPEPAPEVAVEPVGVPSPLDSQALLAKAIEHNVSVDTLERLLTLRERLRAEQARTAFFAALAAFQGECPIITKTKQITIRPQNGAAYSYKYAPLDVIVEQVRALLVKHGLSYTIKTRQDEGSLTAICEAHHEAGHSEPSEVTVPIDRAARMNDTQKVGAARTYAARYAFCGAFGILSGDEDTDAATVDADVAAVEFPPPQRKSAPVSPPAFPAPPPTPPVADSLEGPLRASVAGAKTANGEAAKTSAQWADAITTNQFRRALALLHKAVEDADVLEDAHDEVFNDAHERLRHHPAMGGRGHLSQCPKQRYEELCEAIPKAVEAVLTRPVPPKAKGKVVPYGRRPKPARQAQTPLCR